MQPSFTSDSAVPKQRIAQRYVVEGEIARGGMGVVYRVRDCATGAEHALKRMLVGGATRKVLLVSFEREYQVLASLDHPGIIRVFDYGVEGDEPYYTMELVEGRDLRQLAPMPWRDACHVLRDVASALSLLHARRLIHRDLSPGNVKLTPTGRGKLLDFGALTDFGYSKWIVGTPPMIAPEMLWGGMLNQRTDLYALGALAYWLTTGRNAYPAKRIDQLEDAWLVPPLVPSTLSREIPPALDALVMSLLSTNPLARPGSAAEVIANLNGIAGLEPEADAERLRLARSFLSAPPFVGRDAQMRTISERIEAMVQGQGDALSIVGAAGSGRSRLLEEAGVRAQIAGAAVLRVDASMDPRSHGTSRALVVRLFEALPELAFAHGRLFRGALSMLGQDVLEMVGGSTHDLSQDDSGSRGELAELFAAVAETKPLVLQIDNVEFVDDVSLGLLATLARDAPTHRLLLMVNERSDLAAAPSRGRRTVRELSHPLLLPPLAPVETLALVQSMFGEAPNVERFADWLHDLTAGNPLLTVELARQLVERGEARYQGGLWQLPTRKPATQHSALLDDVLSARVARLSPDALVLARCLGVARVEASFALCALVCEDRDEREVRALLDELARADVVYAEQGVYHFSSAALREVLLARATEREAAYSHLQMGRALLVGESDDPVRTIEAGWHFIRAGEGLKGADLINSVACRPWIARELNANMYRIAPPIEAALGVYAREGRPVQVQLPLLCALAHAGFFEDYRYDDRYADQALEQVAHFTGMRLARRLRFLGRHLALYLGLLVALVRWQLIPRRERPLTFVQVIIQLFATVMSGTAVAALKLDADRAARVADTLEPFNALPSHLTAPLLYRFCRGLQQMGREYQVQASRELDYIVARFGSPRALRLVPKDARVLFLSAAHFARGAFAIFRDDGRAALQSADALERSGLRIYAMAASQLRYLYHLNRGELAEALPHRMRVELHAAHFGSAWQVELWEPAALLPLLFASDDPAAAAHLAHRLEVNARGVPSLSRYARFSELVVEVLRNGDVQPIVERGVPEVEAEVPRSYIGWSAMVAALARFYNQLGDFEHARGWCERALKVMTDEDRDYVVLFLPIDLQTSIADAGLGRIDDALARIDGLLARFDKTRNPFTLGRLHELRGRITWQAGRVEEYKRSLAEVARWFGQSSTPALVAKYERLVELQRVGVGEPSESANTNARHDGTDATKLDTELPKTAS